MDGTKLFWKLGAFAKFDFKRFRADAEKLKVISRQKSGTTKEPAGEPKTLQSHQLDSTNGTVSEKKKKRKKKKKVSKPEQDGSKRIEEMRQLKNKHHIHTHGTDIPDPLGSFEELLTRYQVQPELLRNIQSQGYEAPTGIQRQAIPVLINERDLMACAPTGSGKTAAFILPVLHHLKTAKSCGFRAVVLAPTRELAKQILLEFRKLGKGTGLRSCYIEKEATALKKAKQHFDILVTTPNRLVYMLQSEPPLVCVKNVEWLIVDESDKLFEAGKRGFRDQLGVIYTACSSPKLHRAMFSATFAQDVEQWCKLNLDNVVQVHIGAKNTATNTVDQRLMFTGDEDGKLVAFRNLIREGISPPVLVFVQSKERARELHTELMYDGIHIDVIHADRPQEQRDQVIRDFRIGRTWFLVCTELMGRGIDFKGVNLVINYDFPTSAVSYIHRIGRTGRAGRQGKAVTFFTESDKVNLRSIANMIRQAGCPVPEYMIAIKKPARRERRRLANHVPERKKILTMVPKEYEKMKRKRKYRLQSTQRDAKKARKE